MKAHHAAIGSSPEFQKVLGWFWTAVTNFGTEEMSRLLQFTTGSSQLPPGGLAELSPKLQIAASPCFGTLPTAHTWYNFISPNYFTVICDMPFYYLTVSISCVYLIMRTTNNLKKHC